ncbi:MAG: YggS family pyridoxal phosphate-dependent enzyme [Alphaproteobacteria bacterium]|jgi:pyridoxal phosphate enzyme (YggS family)|nr:YggS family pyridoxal phosphate-dependent enzyme [Alphaproteobacteria bacterium]
MPEKTENLIAARRGKIISEIDAVSEHKVTLVAVSKRQPDERLQAALDSGQRVFGENRVQEASAHWAARRAHYPDLELHLVGPLQTNKADEAVALFDMIETLDRPKLAHALRKSMDAARREVPCLIQVNTGDEPQKSGVGVADLDALLSTATEVCKLDVRGLMCIPPVDEPAGPHFALLAKLAAERNLPVLSMGMSGDYLLAARLGATHVRIGSALFGVREG